MSALSVDATSALGEPLFTTLNVDAAAAVVPARAANDDDGAYQRRCAPIDDAELVALVAAIVERDQVAFERFYDATQRRVLALLRRYSRDLAWIEEVAEDTFFQLWRDAPRFDPTRGRALAWLLTIARSRALDALRKVEREVATVTLDDETIEATAAGATETDPHDRLVQSRRAERLHSALLTLEPQPRQLLALAFFRGLTHEEVASETGLPLGTVKSSIRRALAALKTLLGPDLGPAL